MSPAVKGLLFLLIGVAIFGVGITLIVMRERLGRKPKQTVHRFHVSRQAMREAYKHHQTAKEQRRQRARLAHPSRDKHHRRSA